MRDIRYFYSGVESSGSLFDTIFPEGSNEGSFFLGVSPTFSAIRSVYIGYRLKVWTTPGYIQKVRKIEFRIN